MFLARAVSVPRVGQSARRWRSPGSAGANWLGFSVGAQSGIPVCRRRAAGLLLARPPENHRRQIEHGRFRAFGMVMLHGHHTTLWLLLSGFSSSCMAQLWKSDVGRFSRAPKVVLGGRTRQRPEHDDHFPGEGRAARVE
jgi:hypothetical protein